MFRLDSLALAAVLLFASPALAWEPDVVGLDDLGGSDVTLLQAAAAESPAWEPEIIGLEHTTARSAFHALEAVDPMAFVTPTLVDFHPTTGPGLATTASAARVAPDAGGVEEQLACACRCM